MRLCRILLDWRFALILLIAFLIILRAPYLFINARFWAEEGAVYFSFAYHHYFLESLFSAHQGYYSFFPNLITLIAASIVPLEKAPLFTTISAMLIQLVPYIFVLYRLPNSPVIIWLPLLKIVLCAIIFFVVNTGEIWLNTITTQFHLAIASFFVLFSEQSGVLSRRFLIDWVIIFLGGVTGVITCFLLPAFVVKWILERQKSILVSIIVLSFSCLLQMVYIFLQPNALGNRFSVDQFISKWPVVLRTWMDQFVLWPIFGDKHSFSHEVIIGALSASIIIFFVLTAIKANRSELTPPIIAFFSVATLSLLGSLEMGGGYRYAYVPGVMLVSILTFSITCKAGIRNTILSFLILLSLSNWVPSWKPSLSPWVVEEGPIWSEEVEMWRMNPAMPLKIFPQWGPYDGDWSVTLKSVTQS